MYCYHCGQKLNNSILVCPYCKNTFDRDKLDQVSFDKTIVTISERCKAIPKPYRKIFYIADYEIVLTDEIYLYSFINCFVNHFQNDFRKELKEYISSKNLNKLVDEGEDYLYNRFEGILYASLGYMRNNDLSVTIRTLRNFQSFLARIPFIWAPVYTLASEFEDVQALLKERRAAMNKPRNSAWIGGGVGIGGAIKGQITAGILNAGDGLMNSAGNTARRAIQSHIDSENVRKAKQEMMQSSEFLNAIFSEVDAFFHDIKNCLLIEMGSDVGKSRELYKKIVDNSQEKATNMSVAQAVKVLSENPFQVESYVFLYRENRNYGADLIKLAEFCGLKQNVCDAFLQKVDHSIFEEKMLNLHSIGYDTGLDELRRIKNVLISLETNNPGFVFGKEFQISKREQEYHQKVDELISLVKKCNAEKIISDAFSNHSKKEAVRMLIEMNDNLIDSLLIQRFIEEIKKYGKNEFLKQFNGYFPLHVMEAVLMIRIL